MQDMDMGQRGDLHRQPVVKRALLVGIDEYDKFPTLTGCVNDVDAIVPLLSRNEDGSPCFNCQSKTSASERVTRDLLLTSVQQLLAPGADVALLYFAGHGAPQENDVVLCTSDGTQVTPGVALSEILALVQNSAVGEIILLLDCCFSGAAGGVPQLGSSSAALREGVTLITASRGDQTAAETTAGRGAFSTYLEGALEGGASDVLGKVTLAGVYAYLSESFGPWDQRPVFKSHVDRLHELRLCNPAVPLHELRQLCALFPQPDYEFPLDPSFEPEAEPHDEKNEAILSILQHCRAAKLVQVVGEEHLYFAAMNSTGCALTPLGKHYWRMVEQGLL